MPSLRLVRPAVVSSPGLVLALGLGLSALAGCGGGGGGTTPPAVVTELTTDGSAYQLISPADYSAAGFKLSFATLGADERVALLLVTARSGAGSVTLSASGITGAVGREEPQPIDPRLAAAAVAAGRVGDDESAEALDRRARLDAGHELARVRREAHAQLGALAEPATALTQSARSLAVAPGNTGDTRSFCVFQYMTGTTVRQEATLRARSAHAEFWVTDPAWIGDPNHVDPVTHKAAPIPSFSTTTSARPDFFTSLGTAYENAILPNLTTYFGPESDVDGNGDVLFLFADIMGGASTDGGVVVGYFDPVDVLFPLDATTDCNSLSSQGSNGADMLFLLDPTTFVANIPGLDSLVDGQYPATMAHELQHNVNWNARKGGFASEETWVNEGLSMISEDVAGYGLQTASERSRLRQYLDQYQGFSLTIWPRQSSAIGNYGGVHAYMRYWFDQVGSSFTTAMENRLFTGKGNVEHATGVPFEAGFARFATASLVSNEDSSRYGPGVLPFTGLVTSAGNRLADPIFNYGSFLPGGGLAVPQPDWAPWHHYTGSCGTTPKARTANLNYTALGTAGSTASLLTDGWGAYVTRGTGGAATVSLTPGANTKPYVAVVRFTGGIPDALYTGCP